MQNDEKTEAENSKENETENINADENAIEPLHQINTDNDDSESNEVAVRRSTRNRKLPNWLTSNEFAWMANTHASYEIPKTYVEATKSTENEEWSKAMKEELASLEENNVWILVDRPTNKQVIKNRWVFKIKNLEDKRIRFKARLVARG